MTDKQNNMIKIIMSSYDYDQQREIFVHITLKNVRCMKGARND